MKTCPCFRTILAGVAYAVVAYLIGGLVWGKLFAEHTMAFADLWRAHDDIRMCYGMMLGNLLIGLGFAHAYRKLYAGMQCHSSPAKKGACFGLTLWFAFGLGAGIVWYGYTPVDGYLLIASLVHSAASMIIGGAVVGWVFCDLLDKECGESCDMEKKPAAKAPAKKNPAKSKKKAGAAKIIKKKSAKAAKKPAKAKLVKPKVKKSKAKSKAKPKSKAKSIKRKVGKKKSK